MGRDKVNIDYTLEARKIQTLVRALQKDMSYFNPMLSTKLIKPILELASVEVADIGPDAGFVLDAANKKMTLSTKSLQGMIDTALKLDAGLPLISRLGVDLIKDISLSQYFFHEATHIVQGIAEYRDVQRLKVTFGPSELAGLDTVSDVLAASGYAALQTTLVGGDMANYTRSFLDALTFQVDVCFPAFGFGPEKPHKVNRGLGILLSIVAAQNALHDPKKMIVPFDVPMVVQVSDDHSELAVKTIGLGHEEYSFIHNFDKKVLAEICKSLECGDTLWLISQMRKVMVSG